jgi:hypothetical protein
MRWLVTRRLAPDEQAQPDSGTESRSRSRRMSDSTSIEHCFPGRIAKIGPKAAVFFRRQAGLQRKKSFAVAKSRFPNETPDSWLAGLPFRAKSQSRRSRVRDSSRNGRCSTSNW